MNMHYIYIFCAHRNDEFVAPVKIGISDNPERRVREINTTACPYDVACCEAIGVPHKVLARRIERAFHRVNRDKRLAREWFDMSPLDARLSLLSGILFTMAADGLTFQEAKAWSKTADWSFDHNLTPEVYSSLEKISGSKANALV